MRLDPRSKIAYLGVLGVALFTVPWPEFVLAALVTQPLLYWRAGRDPRELAWAARRLGILFLVVFLSYGLFPPAGALIWRLPAGPWSLPFSPDGAAIGALMCARILALMWASLLVQRTGEPTDLVRGMQGLGMPRLPALALDVCLSLVAQGERALPGGSRRDAGAPELLPNASGLPEEPFRPGSGLGRGAGIPGSGMGPGRGGRALATVRDVVKGDLSILMGPLRRTLERAEARAAEVAPDLEPGTARDLALIAGLAALTQTVRFMKLVPGLPIAPGHKDVLFLPLYVVAADRTRTRWGATLLGVTSGITAFSFGEGQFGPFVILRNVAPGIVVDLLWPVARGRGAAVYGMVGLAAALARLVSLIVIGLLIQAPPIFFAALAPAAVFQASFGLASGFVTFHLLRSLGPEQDAPCPGNPLQDNDRKSVYHITDAAKSDAD